MKICIACGFVTNDTGSFCTLCKNGDLRTVTSMKMSLGKFEGSFELSDEEENVLARLRGYEVLK